MATALLASPALAPAWSADGPDRDLIAGVRAGDDAAFAALYRRYHRRIAAHIYGMVKDYGRAEDIAQDVFMSALRRMRETDREIVFKPWIYEIAKNACIDQFRRSRRAEEVSYDADDALGAADQRHLASTSPTPDAAVDQKLALDDLRGAFGGLSETHRDILVMREFEGLSYNEIGTRLGLTRPAVESTLFRARRRLAEEYEELVSGARCVRVQGIVAAATTATLGTRDRRKLAAHVSHCQPCRRHALRAGIDPALLRAPTRVRSRVAALLPLPLFLRRRLEDTDPTAMSSGSAHVANWSAQVSSFTDPSIVLGWARAAAAAATIAVAGIGAGVATEMVGGSSGSSQRAIREIPPSLLYQSVTRTSRPAGAAFAEHAGRRTTGAQASRMHVAPAHDAVGGGSHGSGGADDPPMSSAPAPPRTPVAGAAAKQLVPAVGAVQSGQPKEVKRPRRLIKRTVTKLLRDSRSAGDAALGQVGAQAQVAVTRTATTVNGLIHGG
jgi:RNA polymerase sigma factor (sigma-70 family)